MALKFRHRDHHYLALSRIRHRRYAVAEQATNAFEYSMAYLLLDLDKIESLVEKSRIWSLNAFNIISLKTQDWFLPEFASNDYTEKKTHAKTQSNSLSQDELSPKQVKQHVLTAIIEQYDEALSLQNTRVLLLTLPRYFNHGFNPVSFYFVFKGAVQSPSYIVADITNTPWNQRHAYVLKCEQDASSASDRDTYQFDFDKVFHVSPFMPMDLAYDWRFSFCESNIIIHMRLLKNNQGKHGQVTRDLVFDATMNMQFEPLTQSTMQTLPIRYPLQTLKVVAGIYWQALKIKLKGNRFYLHPNTQQHTQAQAPQATDMKQHAIQSESTQTEGKL